MADTTTDEVIYEVEPSGVAWLTLNRPDAGNALTREQRRHTLDRPDADQRRGERPGRGPRRPRGLRVRPRDRGRHRPLHRDLRAPGAAARWRGRLSAHALGRSADGQG